MAEIYSIIFDNGFSAQNQDYMPGRIILQLEIMDVLITKILENDPMSQVGLIPLAQKEKNYILTPTNSRPRLSSFLHGIDLCKKLDHTLAILHGTQSVQSSELSSKTLAMMFCSPIENFDDIFTRIYTLAGTGINIRAVCFGDAVEMGNFLQSEIQLDNFKCIVLENDQDFDENVLGFLDDGMGTTDPALAEAIKRSLENK